MYEWLVDNELTPHLLVDTGHAGVQVPEAYVRDGQIVLNIAPGAVRDLHLGNELISFSARFGGVPLEIFVPPAAVLGIYAREAGHGMMFADDPEPDTGLQPDEPPPDDEPPPRSDGRAALKVVK